MMPDCHISCNIKSGANAISHTNKTSRSPVSRSLREVEDAQSFRGSGQLTKGTHIGASNSELKARMNIKHSILVD